LTRYSQYIKVFSIFSELLLLNVCFVIAFFLKHHSFQDPFFSMLYYINFSWVFLISVLKSHNISRTASFFEVLKSSYTVIILHIFLVFGYFVFQQSHRYSRELLLLFYAGLSIATFCFKLLLFWFIKWFRRKGFNYRNVVIISHGDSPANLGNYFQSHPEYGYHVKYELDASQMDGSHLLAALKKHCHNNTIHEIFYSLAGRGYHFINDLINFAEDHLIKIRLVADFNGFTFQDLELENVDFIPVIKVQTTPLDKWDNQLLKRIFDILFSLLIILLILTWLLPILSLLIKVNSKGPVFFKQQRTGRDNRTFLCYKLRTMYLNSESDLLQATKNDPRITSIGRFLRNWSLDELPQFFNVLIGDMSVVGPRPHMLKHTLDFSLELEKFMVRHQIKPGITGLAQSKGYRGETTEPQQKQNRIKLDLFYVRYWSFLLDLKIIFNTIVSLFKVQNN
jgi:putative colanic acid biosynthesis UDP-glucose lipid carrier transferase